MGQQNVAVIGMTATSTPMSSDRGFTFVESLVSVSILAVGLLGLAAVLSAGLTRLTSAPTELVARQKIQEAVESVYMARDTRVLTWASVRNEHGGTGSDGGVFADGPQPLRDPGPDGLVNTADDGGIETLVDPGPDLIAGTEDDAQVPLNQFTREIRIRDVTANLRELQVTVTVKGPHGLRSYVLTTFISSYV
mgnify:CR=1 FL=1